MSQHRYRQNKIKREHSIIDGLLPVLEQIVEHPAVHSITPGRINNRSRTGQPGLTFQYQTEAGLKLMARSNTAVQEVFVVTDKPEPVLSSLRKRGILQGKDGQSKENQDKDDQKKGNPGKAPGREAQEKEKRGKPERKNAGKPDRNGSGKQSQGRATRDADKQRPGQAKGDFSRQRLRRLKAPGKSSSSGESKEPGNSRPSGESPESVSLSAPPDKHPDGGTSDTHAQDAARLPAHADKPSPAHEVKKEPEKQPEKKPETDDRSNVWEEILERHRRLLELEKRQKQGSLEEEEEEPPEL